MSETMDTTILDLTIFDEQYIDDLAERLSECYTNTDTRKGYKTGYLIGIEDAKDAKMPHPEDIKAMKSDVHAYGSFWASIFPASSGISSYKFGYKDGYKDGYMHYLKYIRNFFKGYFEGEKDNNKE